MPQRRTRIVATLGPATDAPAILQGILDAGVDVARINFSHGAREEHLARIARLREAARSAKRPVAVLADLPGPKLRVELDAKRELAPGAEITFSMREGPALAGELAVTEPEMLREVGPGQRILLDDGRLQLKAVRVDGDRLIATVVIGGFLLPKKGLNLPDTPLTFPALTDRDREAIAIAAEGQVDWLGLSFVRSAAAANELRREAQRHGLNLPVLAKMERPEAVAHSEAIIEAFDGIMVARGDLGVEIPLERVPTVQKQLIVQARQAGKPVITATDMLDSMRQNPRPTRAEAGDVANAIYDGSDAVMLSGETAVGSYPIEAVGCMNRIALEAESHLLESDHLVSFIRTLDRSVDDHVTHAVVELACRIGADAIITPTLSGRTARLVARHRPAMAIVAPVPSESVRRQMSVIWGVQTAPMTDHLRDGENRMSGALRAAFESGAVSAGQRVVILAGHPVEGGPHSPTIQFVRVGEGGVALSPA